VVGCVLAPSEEVEVPPRAILSEVFVLGKSFSNTFLDCGFVNYTRSGIKKRSRVTSSFAELCLTKECRWDSLLYFLLPTLPWDSLLGVVSEKVHAPNLV
jgi:hypothetical protein